MAKYSKREIVSNFVKDALPHLPKPAKQDDIDICWKSYISELGITGIQVRSWNPPKIRKNGKLSIR